MKRLTNAIIGAACALAFTATAASAEIVCNREGDCWHVKTRHEYRPEWGLEVHPDNWKWREHEKYRWREHEGRGYWHNGAWIEF
jgi:hypothetical protein